MDTIVNLFVTHYFVVAFGKGPRSLAHRPKYITPNGSARDNLTLQIKINKYRCDIASLNILAFSKISVKQVYVFTNYVLTDFFGGKSIEWNIVVLVP